MNFQLKNIAVRSLTLALVVLILIQGLNGSAACPTMALNDTLLANRQGGVKFWKDPCTWDGVGFGMSVSLAMLGAWAALGPAGYYLLRGIALDNCFS